MDITSRVRQFITTNFYVADPNALSNAAPLLDQGIIDSTGVLEVITFLESEFGVRVDDAEITPDNLDSIERIAAFVQKKKAAA
jgi:acyl carrier protein